MNGPDHNTNEPAKDPAEETSRLVALLEEDYPQLSLWVDEQLEDLEYRWRHYSTPKSLRRRKTFRR